MRPERGRTSAHPWGARTAYRSLGQVGQVGQIGQVGQVGGCGGQERAARRANGPSCVERTGYGVAGRISTSSATTELPASVPVTCTLVPCVRLAQSPPA